MSQIIQKKSDEIEQANIEARQQVTHNRETFVAMTIPQEFTDDMKKLQRVIQYSFENSMREIFISTVESAKEQLRFAISEIEESAGKKVLKTEEDIQLSDAH